MELAAWQQLIEDTYGERDRARGLPASVSWLCEEVGELAKAARTGTRAEQVEEVADVLAWLASIANQLGIPLEEASRRYASGCPKCAAVPCRC